MQAKQATRRASIARNIMRSKIDHEVSGSCAWKVCHIVPNVAIYKNFSRAHLCRRTYKCVRRFPVSSRALHPARVDSQPLTPSISNMVETLIHLELQGNTKFHPVLILLSVSLPISIFFTLVVILLAVCDEGHSRSHSS